MSSRYVGPKLPGKAGIVQKAMDFFINKIPKKKKVSKDIKGFKPGTTFTGTPKYTKEMIIARGDVQKKFGKINEGIKKETTQLRQTLQGMRGERITKSGISKGKDVSPGIYKPLKDKKKQDLAKGGRVGLKFGSKKSNVQKIQETFGPKKKLSPKQMKIAKLAGNPKKIDAADFAKLRRS